jgi:hypothetical protein
MGASTVWEDVCQRCLRTPAADAIVELVQLGFKAELLRGPVVVNLAVGGKHERVIVSDEIAASASCPTLVVAIACTTFNSGLGVLAHRRGRLFS